jgi:HK97 family phage major capsid protein
LADGAVVKRDTKSGLLANKLTRKEYDMKRIYLILAAVFGALLCNLAFGADLHHILPLALPFLVGDIEGDMRSILEAISLGNDAFDGFKSSIEARLNGLERGEAKRKRPAAFAGTSFDDDGSPEVQEHKKAFRKFITKGESHGLLDLQAKAMSDSSGPDGGFAVPKVIDGLIEAAAVNVSPIRAISQVVQISTPDYHKLVNVHGTSSGWVGESAARPETDSPQLKDIAPPMGEIYANLGATQQMLDDVFFNADQWLGDELALEFARAEGAAFVSGNGVNQPMGFLSYPTAATADATRAFGTLEYVATGSAGAFKTLTSTVNPVDDIYTLVSRLKAQYRKDAVFVTNKKTLFQIMGFKDYQGRYIYNPALAPGLQDTILGYPVYEAEDMPDYTTSGALALAFGNFQRGYIIADRIGTRVLRDPFSAKPKVMFYATKRLGGAVLNSECIKLLKFSAS